MTTIVLNTNINEVENKILKISSLVTKTVLKIKISEVENNILDYDTYISTPKFNKLIVESFTARLKEANCMNKTDFDSKLINFNRKFTSNKTKYLEVEKS